VRLAARLRVEAGRLSRRLRTGNYGGLTPSQISALSSLDVHGPLRLGELARLECVTPPTLTAVVTGLEERGYVKRSPDPDDRRSAQVALTRRGRTTLDRIRSERNAILAGRIRALSPADRTRLVDAIDLLTQLAEGDDVR
jgi:DNA-binding MarR family transcriptional regulator